MTALNECSVPAMLSGGNSHETPRQCIIHTLPIQRIRRLFVRVFSHARLLTLCWCATAITLEYTHLNAFCIVMFSSFFIFFLSFVFVVLFFWFWAFVLGECHHICDA